jgi:UDP-glucose 4-epimerase
MKILITGSEGYIGSALLDKIVSRSNTINFSKIDALDIKPPEKFNTIINNKPVKNINFIQADIRNINETKKLDNYDLIFHFAALIDANESVRREQDYIDTNLHGVKNITDALQEEGVFVLASSAAVYGVPDRLPCYETDPLNPVSPYGQNKKDAEKIVRDICDIRKSKYQILRFFNIAGTYRGSYIDSSPEFSKNLFTQLETKFKENDIFTVDGACHFTNDGTCERDFVDINWLSEFLFKCGIMSDQLDSFTTNVGCGESISILQLVTELKRINSDFIYEIGKPREVEIPKSKSSVDVLSKILSAILINSAPTSVQDIAKNIKLEK